MRVKKKRNKNFAQNDRFKCYYSWNNSQGR